MVRSPKIDQWSSGSHIRERTLQLMLLNLLVFHCLSFPLIKLAKKLKEENLSLLELHIDALIICFH